MKIAEVRPLVMGDAWRNLTFVVVRTDDGLEGVGEVRMVNHTSALLGYLEEAIPTHVIGADPFAFEAKLDLQEWDVAALSKLAAAEKSLSFSLAGELTASATVEGTASTRRRAARPTSARSMDCVTPWGRARSERRE